jgi:hypothetical protein
MCVCVNVWVPGFHMCATLHRAGVCLTVCINLQCVCQFYFVSFCCRTCVCVCVCACVSSVCEGVCVRSARHMRSKQFDVCVCVCVCFILCVCLHVNHLSVCGSVPTHVVRMCRTRVCVYVNVCVRSGTYGAHVFDQCVCLAIVMRGVCECVHL